MKLTTNDGQTFATMRQDKRGHWRLPKHIKVQQADLIKPEVQIAAYLATRKSGQTVTLYPHINRHADCARVMVEYAAPSLSLKCAYLTLDQLADYT